MSDGRANNAKNFKGAQGAGHWRAGAPSPNREGRVPAVAELGRRIRIAMEQPEGLDGSTGNWLIDWALACASGRGEFLDRDGKMVTVPTDERSRIAMIRWLTERGYGMPKQEIALTPPAEDDAKLPDMRGKTLAELREIASGGEPPGNVH